MESLRDDFLNFNICILIFEFFSSTDGDMKILRTISQLAELPSGCVLTIGNFDGVHTGHREILAVAKNIAAQNNTKAAAMTFEPHPVAILHPEKTPGVLTSLGLKTYLLETCALDYLIVLKDTASLLRLSAAQFVDKFLAKDVKPKVVVEGEDFNFGAQRAGDIEMLKKIGAEAGFRVIIVPDHHARLPTGQAVRVSSTTIRYMLEAGHVADAAVLLARPYRLIGPVIAGKGRGKKLGFPTLNIQKSAQVIPAESVYAGFIALADTEQDTATADARIPAAFSIGQATTFGDQHPILIEAHVLDAELPTTQNQWLAMDFIQRIRSQHKFRSPDGLARQIADDCKTANDILTQPDTT